MKRKEVFWLVGTLFYVLGVSVVFFGIEVLNPFGSVDFNVHDSYFVMVNYHFLFLFGTLVFFFVYLARMLRRNFKNLTANSVFVVSNVLLVIIMTYIISMVGRIAVFDGTTEFPSLSGGAQEHEGNVFGVLFNVFVPVQVTLIILLAYSAFRTGKNYKTNP